MPRIRTIKPEMWGDEKLSVLPVIDRFVFVALISLADDAGRLLDSVKMLDGVLFLNTDDTCGPSLDSLARHSRIIRGVTASGQRVIQITNWSKHQRVDHPNLKSSLPEILIPQEVAEIREAFASDSRGIPAPTYDLRPVPTTDDQTQPTSGLPSVLPPEVGAALQPFLKGDQTQRRARIGEVQMLLEGMRGVQVTPEAVARGLGDMVSGGVAFSALALKGFARKAVGTLQGEAGARAAQEALKPLSPVLRQPDANQMPSEDEFEG